MCKSSSGSWRYATDLLQSLNDRNPTVDRLSLGVEMRGVMSALGNRRDEEKSERATDEVTPFLPYPGFEYPSMLRVGVR